MHAASAELAFEQLVLLVKQSRGGQELAREDIKNLLYLLIDVVVQFGVEHHERCIKEIWYDPARKRRTPGGRPLGRRGSRAASRRSSSLVGLLIGCAVPRGLSVPAVGARRSADGDAADDRALRLLLRRARGRSPQALDYLRRRTCVVRADSAAARAAAEAARAARRCALRDARREIARAGLFGDHGGSSSGGSAGAV